MHAQVDAMRRAAEMFIVQESGRLNQSAEQVLQAAQESLSREASVDDSTCCSLLSAMSN